MGILFCCTAVHSDLTLSPLRNSAPKKRYMNGHLISTIFPNHNYMGFMGIPVKKRDMNAIYPRFL